MMKDKFRELPCVDDVRRMIKDEMRHFTKKDIEKKDKKKWCILGVGVIVALVGVIIWVAKRRDKDLEEHYEYFDDLDGDDYDEFDDSIYDSDEEDTIEYVKINDFIKDEDAKDEDVKDEVKVDEVVEEVKEEPKKNTRKSRSKKEEKDKVEDETK